MTIPTISTLPTAPARTDPPATFVTRADSFLAALVVMQGELNTTIGAMNTGIDTTNSNVILASEWAIKNDAAVSGTDFSAYAHAVGAAPTGSAKEWSTEAEDVIVADGEYSSKHYSIKSAASAAASLNSENNAATSETNAENSAIAAGISETNAANTYDQFDDRYLGAFATDPTTDNDGDPLVTGAQYFNTTSDATKVYNGSAWQDSAAIATTVTLSQVTDFPSQSGQSGKYLSTNGTVPTWETLTTDQTLGTLTKTFTAGEASTINLTKTVLTPVVSVTKEVPQIGVTNNEWDVNSTTENYERLNSAPATTLDFVASLAGASYSNKSFSFAAITSVPTDISFSSDGAKLYVIDQGTTLVYQFSLSTAWDINTASYDSKSFSVASQLANPTALVVSYDGTKLYALGDVNDTIYQYSLSVAWDINTASYDSKSFNVASYETRPNGMFFKADGSIVYIVGQDNDSVYQFELSTNWDISTASYSSKTVSVFSEDTFMHGITFNSLGTKMYLAGGGNAKVFQYSLTTAWDVSSASYDSVFYSFSSFLSVIAGLAIKSNNQSLFLLGRNNEAIYEVDLPTPLALGTGSFASADVGKTIEANDGVFVLTATDGSYVETTAPTSYDQVASGDWEMYGVVYNAVDGDLELSGVLDPATTFDVSTAVYSQNFSVAGQDTVPVGIAFNTDGTKMFIVGYSGQDVNEYTLSTGFDISTTSFVDSFSVAGQDTNPQAVAFNTDGTKMFIVGSTGDAVYEYDLTTGFDVSTASFVDSFSVASQETLPSGIAFNTDGTKMFIVGFVGDAVYEYTLSTGFDVSTSSFVDSFSIVSQETDPRGIAFNTDGTKMFIVGNDGDEVNEYTLSTGFDVSTASFVDSFSVSAQESLPQGIAFNDTGTKMFIVGSNGDDVNEYSIGSTAITTGYQPVHTKASIDTTFWIDINDMTALEDAGSGEIYYALSTDDRTTYTVVDETLGERDIVRDNAGTWQYNSNATYVSETWEDAAVNAELPSLAEAMEGASFTIDQFDVSTSVFVDSFSVSAQEALPNGIAFNPTGTKMFVVGLTGDDVNEYDLSTGFDVSTASFVDAFSVSAQETEPTGIAFSTDGTKMFIVGAVGDDVNEYTLSTGFDVSTANFVDSFSVSAQETVPQDIAFNTDGTKMFIVGSTGDDVNEYTLSTGFDVSTASFVDAFSVASQDTVPTGIAFSTNGTKMFIVGSTGDAVYEYTLSTGFDVSTASFVDSFSVATQETNPQAIALNTDGTKMFIVGYVGPAVNEYTLGTTVYTNQMNKTQLDAVTDPNHIALGNDLDLAIVFNMTSGTTVPSSDGVAINYDANVLNKGAVLGTDYDFDAPAGDEVRVTALASGNFKVRVV